MGREKIPNENCFEIQIFSANREAVSQRIRLRRNMAVKDLRFVVRPEDFPSKEPWAFLVVSSGDTRASWGLSGRASFLEKKRVFSLCNSVLHSLQTWLEISPMESLALAASLALTRSFNPDQMGLREFTREGDLIPRVKPPLATVRPSSYKGKLRLDSGYED